MSNRESGLSFLRRKSFATLASVSLLFLTLILAFQNFSPATLSPLLFNQIGVISFPGCNSTSWNQVPNMPDYFVGQVYANSSNVSDCALDSTYTLAWGKMNWEKNQISFVGKMINVPFQIQNGGYTVQTASNPAVAFFGNEYWMAFECFGLGFTGSVAVCMAPVDFAKGVDTSRAFVAVEGASHNPKSAYDYSAQTPKLLSDDGRLYLYWSAAKISKANPEPAHWNSITQRGVELEMDPSLKIPVAKNFGTEIPSDHPLTVEVFGLEQAPGQGQSAEAFQIVKVDSDYFLLGAVGNCVLPDDPSAGCYRLTVRRASQALGPDIFNHDRVPDLMLPSNPVQNVHWMQSPDGNAHLIGQALAPTISRNKMAAGLFILDVPYASSFFHPTETNAVEADPISVTVNAADLALLQAPADSVGLQTAANQLYAGMDQLGFLQTILARPEADALYGTKDLPTVEFIKASYRMILGHEADPADLTNAQRAIDRGGLSRLNFLMTLVKSPEFQTHQPLVAPLYVL
jgi:hypothetical protein